MIEGRAVIESIEKAKASIITLGGQFKSNYSFKDIIFVPSKKICLNLRKDLNIPGKDGNMNYIIAKYSSKILRNTSHR